MMSAPDLCDIPTCCQGELNSGNGDPSSHWGRQPWCHLLDKVQSPRGFYQLAPFLLLLGVMSHLYLGQGELEDVSTRGNKGSEEPEWQDTRMLAEPLSQD